MLNFYIVDVFAVGKYTGNQLAVFTGDEVAKLSDIDMQRIAKEMNYSETTFIPSNEMKNGGYDVRIFTPEQELPFAGHPTLGTAFILQQEIIKNQVETVILNLKVGQIPVTLHYAVDSVEWLWMRQKTPTFGQGFSPDQIAPVLNLDVAEIDNRFPIEEVSTGVPFIIVPLNSLASVKRIKVNKEKYFDLIRNTKAKAILVFCPETYHAENNLNVRMFADAMGVPEDPATGSANGCLAGYLVEYAYFGESSIDIKVEQGYEIGRPSLLLLKAQRSATGIEVNVGGNSIIIAKGEFV
ncbi:MAG TPA: PhzF family phenazine biosynthesis protein [Leptolyngbyaceae cyanobacterium]